MIVLFILFTIIKCNYDNNNCTYSQLYWKNNIDKWPIPLSESKICNNLLWIDIMKIEPIKMAIYDNIDWVLCFQQTCTSILNSANLNEGKYLNNNMIRDSILFLINEMENHCNNISNFKNDNRIYNYLELIQYYNIGLLGYPRCKNEFNNTLQKEYEYNPYIYIPYTINDGNNTLYNNDYKLKRVYKIQMILMIVLSILICIILPGLIIYIIIISNNNRKYSLFYPLPLDDNDNNKKYYQCETEYSEDETESSSK